MPGTLLRESKSKSLTQNCYLFITDCIKNVPNDDWADKINY